MKEINEILEEIQYRIDDFQHTPYRISRFFGKIAKIFAYIPVIWKDEDWDFEYILDLLAFKINRMKSHIYKNNFISKLDQRRIFIGMNQVLDHINNYKNSDEAYENIHGKFPINIGHRFKEVEDGCVQMITTNEDAKRDLTEEEDDLYFKHIKAKVDFEQQEWKAIFNTIKEEGQYWWE